MEDQILKAITHLTGLTPIEKVTEDRYCLKLGNKNPLEIGYDKSRRLFIVENMRYSALVKMLNVLTEMMKDYNSFIDWIKEENV